MGRNKKEAFKAKPLLKGQTVVYEKPFKGQLVVITRERNEYLPGFVFWERPEVPGNQFDCLSENGYDTLEGAVRALKRLINLEIKDGRIK